jgi:alanine racemase
MDQIMVDTTDIPQARAGDVAVLIGAQENRFIGADELAGWAGTISYEVLLGITARVHRQYVPLEHKADEKENGSWQNR